MYISIIPLIVFSFAHPVFLHANVGMLPQSKSWLLPSSFLPLPYPGLSQRCLKTINQIQCGNRYKYSHCLVVVVRWLQINFEKATQHWVLFTPTFPTVQATVRNRLSSYVTKPTSQSRESQTFRLAYHWFVLPPCQVLLRDF